MSAEVNAHPPCIVCGGPMLRRPSDLKTEFRRRTICSSECRGRRAAAVNASRPVVLKVYPHPPCTECGGPIVRRDGETMRRFKARTCCCPVCSHAKGSKAQAGIVRGFGTGWPAQTEDSGISGQCFAHHNLALRGSGVIKLDRPPTHIPTANALGD